MQKALQALKKKGYRITLARMALLESLENSTTPHTIQELADRTSSNEASVYRNIELFSKEHLIETINLADSLPRYALSHGHHHHIACTNCDFIAHTPCDTAEPATPSHPAFTKITNHEVTYYGICQNCS
ncbi:MAG: Fe2+ or Zn2+ uptake regulation protein [Patiriisocius sp.]|jgi:Fe2+ or Zn2+ uptake regulation protein